jgi:hypothetical protein
MYIGDGPKLADDNPIQYEVVGLPPGRTVLIGQDVSTLENSPDEGRRSRRMARELRQPRGCLDSGKGQLVLNAAPLRFKGQASCPTTPACLAVAIFAPLFAELAHYQAYLAGRSVMRERLVDVC